MIVVDTNVIAYLFIEGEMTKVAENALRRDAVWVAPLLWRSEMRNVLVASIRVGRLTLADAQRVMDAALSLMRGREYDVPSAQVLALAAAHGCSAYDTEFVALAQDLGLTLVTSDRRLLAAFPDQAVSLAAFSGIG